MNINTYYQIKDTLKPCKIEDLNNRKVPYVANISWEEFEKNNKVFDMGIDLDMKIEETGATIIQVNYDSLTGCFAVPIHDNDSSTNHTFAFAIDERGIVFINDDGIAQNVIDKIKDSKKWKFPSLERFIYDFLEGIVTGDLILLENYEKEMEKMEDRILEGDLEDIIERMVDIRGELLDIRLHYEQLIDLGQELEENENHFFDESNLRFFRLFIERVERLQHIVTSLRDHSMQVRDLYQSKMDEKQNRNMTLLTVIATIFMPITLLTGWYGMNFEYMPELSRPWAYPAMVGVCILIIITSLTIFKKKKMI